MAALDVVAVPSHKAFLSEVKSGSLDQRVFKWNRLKAQNLIGSKEESIVVREKPVSTFSHDALKTCQNRKLAHFTVSIKL